MQKLNDREKAGVFREKLNENFSNLDDSLDKHKDNKENPHEVNVGQIEFEDGETIQQKYDNGQLAAVPTGGNAGQILSKASSKDFDTKWEDREVVKDIIWLPNVTESGELSWSRSSTEKTPKTVNISGRDGVPGQNGKDGISPTIRIADTVTGDAGTDAIVENIGTSTDVHLVFTIPRGERGLTGESGGGTGEYPENVMDADIYDPQRRKKDIFSYVDGITGDIGLVLNRINRKVV